MPLTFDNMPGLAGNMLVLARNQHDVIASGPCLVLNTMIPQFRGVVGAVPNTMLFAFYRIYWLLLAIIRPGAGFPHGALLVAFTIHVNRLGIALEACIAAGLATGPCSPSVARKRLRRKAAELYAVNPAPFEAIAADMYALVMPVPPLVPPGGAAIAVAAPANSVTAAAAELGMAVFEDNTLLPLADAEPILFPRFDMADRGVGSGCDFMYETWRAQLTQTLPVALANAIPPDQMAGQIWRRFKAHLTDELLATCHEPTQARMLHHIAFTAAVGLDATNAVELLQHTEVMSLAIPVDTPGPEIIRMMGVIVQAVLGNVPPVLPNVSLADSHLTNDHLRDRMLRPDALALSPTGRVTLLVTEYSDANERRNAAPRSESEPERLLGGYTRQYDPALRAKVNSAPFLALSQQLQGMFNAGTHPYEIIRFIFGSCEVLFIHPLLGRKNVLSGVPLVERIATELRQHGPGFLGDSAYRAILPPIPAGAVVLPPPELVPEWDSLCKGELTIDVENLIPRLKAFVNGPQATYDKVPKDQRYRSSVRLAEIGTVATKMYADLGYPSPAGTPGTPEEIFKLAALYYAEAAALRDEVKQAIVADALMAIDQERSAQFKTDLMAGDPARVLGGQYAIPNSPGLRALTAARQELTSSQVLARQLAALKGQTGVPVHVSVSDLRVTKPGPQSGNPIAPSDKVKEELDKDKETPPPTPEVEPAIGALSKLVTYNDDKTIMYMGKKQKTAVDLVEFKKQFPGACAAVWCSTHKYPWALCDEADSKHHTSKTSGAHAVRRDFRSKVLPTLLIAAAAGAKGCQVSPVPDPASSLSLSPLSVEAKVVATGCEGAWTSGATVRDIKQWSPLFDQTGAELLLTAFAPETVAARKRAREESPSCERCDVVTCPNDLIDCPLPSAPAASPPPLPPDAECSLCEVSSSEACEAAGSCDTLPVVAGARLEVLSLCSGPFDAVHGLPFFNGLFGMATRQLDTMYGGPAHNITQKQLLSEITCEASDGRYCAITGGFPCKTCSVSRIFDTHSGPRVVRNAWFPDGIPGLPRRSYRELVHANRIFDCGAQIMMAGRQGGASLVVENPAARHNPFAYYGRLYASNGCTALHGSYWLTRSWRLLRRATGMKTSTFAYCAVDPTSEYQKYTTFAYTPELEPVMGDLDAQLCEHPPHFHKHVGGQDDSGNWRTADMAAWPAVVNCHIAVSIARDLGLVPADCTVSKVLDSVKNISGAPHPGIAVAPWQPTHSPTTVQPGVPHIALSEITRDAHLHIPIYLKGNETRFGVLGGQPLRVVGWESRPTSKEADSTRARKWDESLFPGRSDVHAFWLLSRSDVCGKANVSITSCCVVDPPPDGLQWRSVDSAVGFGPVPSRNLLWATLDAIDCARLRQTCQMLWLSMSELAMPMPRNTSLEPLTGAMNLTPITPAGTQVSTHATKLPWDDAVADGFAAVESCRTHLTAAIDSGLYASDITAELCAWLDMCRPPRLGDIGLHLQDSCYRFDDTRLASIRYPHHTRTVPTLPMAPLPLPPIQSLVPSSATSWSHVLLPDTYKACERYFREMRAWHLYVLRHATAQGAPSVKQVAFGPEGLHDWAARLVERGEVLVRQEGRIQLMDRSVIPPTHWNRSYLQEVLADSMDAGLRDAVVTHGVDFLAELPPVTVLLRHLPGLADGYHSVNSELLRLTGLSWYNYSPAYAPDGSLEFGMIPLRMIAHMAVPRAKSGRYRRVADNGQPRRPLRTLDGKILVQSLAEACGWDESKAMRRAAEGTSKAFLRHSPAIRRPDSRPAALTPASSKTPSQIAAMVAAGQLSPPEAQWQLSLPRHPPELKPLFVDLLLQICLVGYMAHLTGANMVGFGDDEADCFHQFITALRQRWACGIMMLDPEQVLAGLVTPELVEFIEGCMSMGTPPSSGYAQRLNTELGEDYERRCNDALLPVLQSLAAGNDRLQRYIDERLAMGEQSGRRELKTVACLFYSDDPLVITLDVFIAPAIVIWTEHMGPRGVNMIMGTPLKREIGVSLSWIGGEVFLSGGLGFISGDKQARTLGTLRELADGKCSVEDAEKLIGLLNHLVCVMLLPYHVMYGMYSILDEARLLQLAHADMAPLPAQAAKSVARWIDRVGSTAGCSALAAAFHSSLPLSSTVISRIYQDAAVEGTNYPGICGNFYRYYYILALTAEWRRLPIVALEFAGPIISLMTFSHLLPDAPQALIMDALVVPIILASRARDASPMMQFFHQKFLALPIVVDLGQLLMAGQTYGGRNVVTDAGSRGREQELIDLLRHMGWQAVRLEPPVAAFDMMAEAYELWRSLSPAERALGTSHRSNSAGDGPSSVHTALVSTADDTDAQSAHTALVVDRPPAHGRWPGQVPCVLDASPLTPSAAATLRGAWEVVDPLGPPLTVPELPCMPGRWPGGVPISAGQVVRPSHPYARPQQQLQPAVTSRTTHVGESLSRELHAVDSAYAIRPADGSWLGDLMQQMASFLETSYAPSTNRVDESHMRAWTEITNELGTPAIRDNLDANSGADPVGHRNELLLLALAVLLKFLRMAPRSHEDPAADPNSALAMVRGVRREHQRRGIVMAPLTIAARVCRGMCRAYVDRYGVRDVRRKKPLTDALIVGMLLTAAGASFGGVVWDPTSYVGVAVIACFSTLAEEGSRKDEVAKLSADTPRCAGRFTFASLVWLIAAIELPAPTAAQLNSMDPARGDGVYLKHGRAKNDFFGAFFAATPSFLPFSATAVRNACRALRALELMAAVAPEQRGVTPLFGPTVGDEFTHSVLEGYFFLLLVRGAMVPESLMRNYSIHSFRIWLACALMARDVPRPMIKRLLRWRGDESLELYARLNDSEWRGYVFSTYGAVVDSTVAGRLTTLGHLDFEQVAPTVAQLED